jgi:hypothetical protein
MKTAEVAIEHVLSGILALCAFALPFFSHEQMNLKLIQSGAVVGILGAGYLFGVIFDRVADTILNPVEHYLRLSVAGRHFAQSKLAYEGDPFPQDNLEQFLRQQNDGRLEWMDSLRSRIRTSRGLSVLGAPAAMGIAIFVEPNAAQSNLRGNPLSFVVTNLILVLLSVLVTTFLTWKKNPWYEAFKSLRTSDLVTGGSDLMKDALLSTVLFSSLYFLMLANSIIATAIILSSHRFTRLAMIIAGAAIATLVLMVWYRITATYMTFLARNLPELIQPKESKNVSTQS